MKMFKKRFLFKLLIFLALTTNFAFGYMIPLFWKEEGALYFSTLALISLLAGMVILNVKKAFIYLFACLVTGGMLTTVIYILPAVVFGELWRIELALAFLVPILVRGLVISLALSVFVVIIGCFLGQALTGEEHLE